MKQMSSNLPFHLRLFNDRVRAMNQGGLRVLTLTADEARNLHTEIYNLLALTAKLANTDAPIVTVTMDGGGFK
jgi:hypothetical protein